MKIRQKVWLLFVIVLADLILSGAAVRMLAGREETGAVWKKIGGNQAETAGNMQMADLEPEERCRDKETGKCVALTFDDGPNAVYTKPLLDGLRDRKIRASFFLVGECIDGKEELVAQMAEDGHLIGVHCLTHRDLTKENLSDAERELEETREKIQSVTGTKPEYVRPPYGKWNAALGETVDMIPVFWDVDSIDWRLKNTEKVAAKVLKETENGDIILMHDEFRTSVEAAFRIIDNLTAKGYTFVTIDELMVD